MRVLIAEDDPVSRRSLEAMLVKRGYDVVVGCNGEEALKVLQGADPPKLAIIDWMLPDVEGTQICRQIRAVQHESYVYIIMLTAKGQKKDVIEGLDAGADDYVIKPFDMQELDARLRAGARILDLQSRLFSAQESLENQATHDPLTNLPNRLLFSDRLTRKLADAHRHRQMLAVMFLDLDQFKIINDTLGHNVGDLLLSDVAVRLSELLREVDTVARMGGDEFTIILPEVAGREVVGLIAKRVLKTLSKPFTLSDREVFVSASIGISLYPSDGANAETLVKNADTAMYRAKEQGRNRYQFYTEALNTATSERMKLGNDLHKALKGGEFVIHYQPQVDMDTGSILGTEALVRWHHPDIGLIAPMEFIPLAEEIGLIVPISEWVLRTACAQNKAWQDAGFPPMDVAVNISACHLREEGLARAVRKALNGMSLDFRYVTLEITESALMSNLDIAVETLCDLKTMGVRIAIDDFGTGYSSLNYLKRLPADVVKIDRSFVRDIASNPDDAGIVGAVVAMAHSLKLKVIAEGVETIEQVQFLRSLNCDVMQGYFISRPLPPDEITYLLQRSVDQTVHCIERAA